MSNDQKNKKMGINDLYIYQLAMILGEDVWSVVSQWDFFAKDTVGKQLVRSADSVAANISEGFGRYHFKENIHHCYIARGSLLETRTWLDKAQRRLLITTDEHQIFDNKINDLGKRLNAYIRTIGKQSGSSTNMISEPLTIYNVEPTHLDFQWNNPSNLLPSEEFS